MKTARFPFTNEEPISIMTKDGTWHKAGKKQKFVESARGQAWELLDFNDGFGRLVKRFPKERVLVVHE